MVELRGSFDPESGLAIEGRLRNVVERLFHDTTPDSCPTDPYAKQDHLRALALIEILTGTTKPAGQPDIIIVIDHQTMCTGLHDRSIIDVGNDQLSLPIETIRKMACYANIIPVVLDSNGVALDEGRNTRLATREQRRAMRAMYPTCAIPGCRVAFEQCVLHHIKYWERLGDTDLDNLLPLCTKHHHLAHEGGWKLHLHPHTRTLTITHPDGTTQTTGPPRARVRSSRSSSPG
jgi:hypothetical protein